jgi:serine/threonine protein phosphatase PrpC
LVEERKLDLAVWKEFMRAIAAGISDVGLQRDHNEDSFAILKEQTLYIVADGMGGHRAGDVASRLATESIVDFFRASTGEGFSWPFQVDARLSDDENRLLSGIRLANRHIIERSTRSRECQGMGTTVVGALFSPQKKKMYIGHVGDSRAYRVRKKQIQQMTRDHSLVNDYLLAMPELTEEQKSELPKNVITRALGMQDQVAVDIQSDDAQVGDIYVLCSDGLSGMVEDQEILEAVLESPDAEAACRRLVALANEHGGEDNIAALIVRIEPSAEGEISLSDTLPTPVTIRHREESIPDGQADTPPAPNARPGESKAD